MSKSLRTALKCQRCCKNPQLNLFWRIWFSVSLCRAWICQRCSWPSRWAGAHHFASTGMGCPNAELPGKTQLLKHRPSMLKSLQWAVFS